MAIRSDRQRRVLGLLWWVLDPLLAFLTYWLIFKIGLRAGGSDYYLEKLAVGLLVWRWYQTSISHGSSSLILAKPEYLNFPVPKAVYPVSGFFLGGWKFVVVFGALFVGLAASGRAQPALLDLGILLATLVVLGVLILGASALLAAIVPFSPDLRQVVDFLVGLQFFVSNVVFPLDMMPAQIYRFAWVNPMYLLIKAVQDACGFGGHASAVRWFDLLYPLVLGGLLLGVGLELLSRFSGEYGKINS